MNSSDFFFFLCFLSNSSRMHYSWILQEFIRKFYLCNHSEAMLYLCNPSRMHYSWILQEFITKFKDSLQKWVFISNPSGIWWKIEFLSSLKKLYTITSIFYAILRWCIIIIEFFKNSWRIKISIICTILQGYINTEFFRNS